MGLGLFEAVKKYQSFNGVQTDAQNQGRSFVQGQSEPRCKPLLERDPTAIDPNGNLHLVNRHKRQFARALNRVEESRLEKKQLQVQLGRNITTKSMLYETNKMKRMKESFEQNRGKHIEIMKGKLPDYSTIRKRNRVKQRHINANSCQTLAFSFADEKWEPLGRWVRYPPRYSYPTWSRHPTRYASLSPLVRDNTKASRSTQPWKWTSAAMVTFPVEFIQAGTI